MAVVTLKGCQLLWLLAVERRLAAPLLIGSGVSAGPAKSAAMRGLGRDSVFRILRVPADAQHRLQLQYDLILRCQQIYLVNGSMPEVTEDLSA